MPETSAFIRLKEVIKIYKAKGIEVVALTGLDLVVSEGEMVAIVGSSGSGKSTLLNLLGGLDQATAGRVTVDGLDMNSLTARGLARYRKKMVGFVWQNTARNLVSYLTALENVELAMMVAGRVDKQWAKHLLSRVGLEASAHSTPGQMSGGEQQRVAIAVALANRPRILLADEPTGAVDSKTAAILLNLMRSLRDDLGLTVLIVTHDPRIAAATERTVAIRDGRVAQESLGDASQETSLEEALSAARREYVLMDAKGRLQIPGEILETARLTGAERLKASAEDGRIVLAKADQ